MSLKTTDQLPDYDGERVVYAFRTAINAMLGCGYTAEQIIKTLNEELEEWRKQ